MSTTGQKSDAEWRQVLTPEQYHVLREAGTDAPFTGEYVEAREDGVYLCAACGAELFSTSEQYNSWCGWPSFTDVIDPERVNLIEDLSHGMRRIEVTCKNCDGHLGHLFHDGHGPDGARYCINSTSIKHEV